MNNNNSFEYFHFDGRITSQLFEKRTKHHVWLVIVTFNFATNVDA